MTTGATADGGKRGGKRREYRRVKKTYLRGGPPIESLQLFVEFAARIKTGQVRSLRGLSRGMGFSPSHLGKWLPEFAAQLNLTEASLIELPTAGRPFVLLKTAAAQLLTEIKNLLRDYRRVSTLAGEAAEQIACGTWQWLMGRVFHRAVVRFTADQATRGWRTSLRLFEYSSDAMMDDLARGVIDIGFGAPEQDLRAMYADSLEVVGPTVEATSELVAVAPIDHPWKGGATGGSVAFANLVHETLCLIDYDRIRQFARFRARGVTSGRLIVVENYASVLGVVGEAARQTPTAQMVGILPRFGVMAADGRPLDPALGVYKIADMPNPSDRFAFWARKSSSLHPEFDRFTRCVAEIANEVWRGAGRAEGPAPARGKRGRRRAD